MKVKFLILSILIFTFQVYAQKYYLSEYGKENGLTSSHIHTVSQDTIGQIWVGTDDGLYLFNGIEFKPVKRGIPSKYIRDIQVNKAGTFVASHDAGLSFYKPGLDTCIFMDSFIDEAVQSNTLKYPNRLFWEPGNKLWVSQPDGRLTRLVNGKAESILEEKQDVDQFRSHYSFALVTPTDILIASTSGNLYLWDGSKQEMILINYIFPMEDILFQAGKLFLAGDHLAVATWNASSKSINITWEEDQNAYKYRALAEDTLGRVYVGTQEHGLFQLSAQDNVFELSEVFSNNDPHRVDRLPFKQIHSIYVSNDNALWICSEEGLGLLQRRFFEGAQNLPNDLSTAICESDDGSIYVAMGDIYRIQKSGREYIATKLDAPSVGVFNALAVYDNELWAGTNTGSIARMSADGRLLKLYPFSERGAGIFRACADRQGRKWFCQSPHEKPIIGVTMIDRNGDVHFYDDNKGFDNRMLTVREGPKGELFAAGIGTKSYLYKFLPDEDVFVNMSIPFNFAVSPNFEVHDIAIDERGLVWMATTDGLLRHDMESVIRPDIGAEYTGKEIRAVAVLPDKSLWLSSDIYGILRYFEDDVLSFSEDSGLPTKIMAYRGMLVDQDYKLWVNTLEGVVHTSENMPQPFATPKPVLTQINYKGRPISAPDGYYECTLNGELELRFISTTFPGNLTTYQYRVIQSDNDPWINLGNQNRATILIDQSNISGVEIRARKAGGHDWSKPKKILIEALLPWHKRRPTHFLLGVLGLSAIFIIWRASSKKYQRKIVDLESQIEDQNSRKRIDMDLSQTVSTGHESADMVLLTAVSDMLYEVTEKTVAGMKWDHIMERLSMVLLKFPHITAFEIATLNKTTNSFLIDGYSQVKPGFYQRDEQWSKTNSIFAEAMKVQRVVCHQNALQNNEYLIEWTGQFHTIISVPFIMGGKEDTVLCLYGDEQINHSMILKTMQALANYLELIR